MNNIKDNEFKYLSNLDNLILLHTDIKDNYLYQGFMNNSILNEFIDILLKNILFEDTEEYDSDSDEDNFNDILLLEK